MKKLIVSAIDNNDQLWYEHVIPFILSLKDTDFNGEIGFINYGLSEEKQATLIAQGCQVFSPANRYTEILIDRQTSVAQIANNETFSHIALYDADIWFPHSHLSLFEQLTESQALYACYDLWKCTFLYSCLNQYDLGKFEEKIDRLLAQNGYVWQAGLIAGSREAWLNYDNYLTTLLADETQFHMAYGVDTSALNLYGADTNNLRHLPEKYNCPPVWGIRSHNFGQGIEYYFEGEKVEGLHVTRAHRKGGEYSYHHVREFDYFDKGRFLRIKDYPYWTISKESIVVERGIVYENPVELTLDTAETDGVFFVDVDQQGTFRPKNSFICETSGISKIRLKNESNQPQSLHFHFETVLNFSLCEAVYFNTANGEFNLTPHFSHQIELQPNESVEFITRELDVENKRLRWVFYNLKLI